MRAKSSQVSATVSADGLRADARRNRERVIRAAAEAFAMHGIDVPMATIARRAGLGTATLYRRFPARDDLVREVFADQVTACIDVVERARVDPAPWARLQLGAAPHRGHASCRPRLQRCVPAGFSEGRGGGAPHSC